MSAYLQRLAQRTGLVSAGASTPTPGKTAPLPEVDVLQELAPNPTIAADPTSNPRPDAAASTRSAPMPPLVSFDSPDTEPTETTPVGQPPGQPAFEQRSFQSTSRPRREEPRPAQPVTPVPARRPDAQSLERPADAFNGPGTEKATATPAPEFEPLVPAPPRRPGASAPGAETRHPSSLGSTPPPPTPTPEDLDEWAPAKPRSPSRTRTRTTAPSPAPVETSLAGPLRRTYPPTPPARSATKAPRGGSPASVRIGSVHVDVHQPPPPPVAAPTPAPTARPAPTPPAPRPVSLRRLYLRGW